MTDTQILFEIFIILWSEALLTDDKGYVIPLPFKGHVSVWTDDDLKYFDALNQCQIHVAWTLPRQCALIIYRNRTLVGPA